MAQEPIQDLMWTFFNRSLAVAKAAGVQTERIMLDPGIGFGLGPNVRTYSYYKNSGRFAKVSDLSGSLPQTFVVNIIEESWIWGESFNGDWFWNRDLASSHLTSIAASQGESK